MQTNMQKHARAKTCKSGHPTRAGDNTRGPSPEPKPGKGEFIKHPGQAAADPPGRKAPGPRSRRPPGPEGTPEIPIVRHLKPNGQKPRPRCCKEHREIGMPTGQKHAKRRPAPG